MMRIGIGYDSHRLGKKRRLFLGGIEIPYEKGLVGHSDADVLLHAICDALLGAAGLGDIGTHFPSSDPAFKDAASALFLRRVGELVGQAGYRIVNIDCVILAEQPRLALFYGRMTAEISRLLGIEISQVNVKATTTDGMDDVGRGEGISARAVALLSDQ